ncbi:hypothetical protein M8J75_005968 [Diaphorina citri]|nr:hypothetical protein M8J75_005968 [Diaphorina citri]
MEGMRFIGILIFLGSALGEAPQEYSSDDEYSSIAYSDSYSPQSVAKSAPYPTNAAPYPAKSAPYPAKTYGSPSYSYGTPAPVAAAPAPAPAPAPASGPGPTGTGPGPSASGPGPSGPGPAGGPGPSALGPSGPGPFGPGAFGPGPFGPGPFGPFGFGAGPFLPYAYGPYAFKKGLLAYFLTKVKVGFKYLEALLAPIGTITTLMNVMNFLKIKVVPKLATKFHELQTVHPHDVAEAITAARRYKRSLQDLDDLTQRVLSAIDKNMCTEKLVCQIGKKASHMVSVDSNWVNSTLGMLKKIESPNSLISIFRQSMSNGISDCNVILCKNVHSSHEPDSSIPVESNHLDKDSSKTLLDEEEGIEDGSGYEEEEVETSQD